MNGRKSNPKVLTLASVIVVASGLLAWALVALFQADNARWEGETAGEDFYQEETPPEELEPEAETSPAAPAAPVEQAAPAQTPAAPTPPAPAVQGKAKPAAPAQQKRQQKP